jgi:DNA-binding MarR family transcriptional regulator
VHHIDNIMSVWQCIVIMATAEFQDRPTDVLPAENGQSTADAAFHDKLQVLLAEATALANQLRKTAASGPRQADSPGGGWSVLQVLGRLGPLTVPAIARIRTVSRQSIQTLVNRLEAHGFVALAANPAHKKSGLVHLTDRGGRLVAAVTERESKSSEALLPYVSETRLVSAARLLRQLRELLAGNGLPSAEVAGDRPARKRARALPKPAHRSKAVPAPTDMPPAPEPTEPDEGDFPVNLL